MPLTLNVGISKKLGLRDYSSLGASCNVAVELPSNLVFDDLEAFRRQARQAFTACSQAVGEELARQQADQGHNNSLPSNGRNGNGHNGNAPARRANGRRATASQARALRAIADRQQLDLAAELRSRFGIDRPEDLSITEASRLIDELKAPANGNGGGR
jgi:hypothetical protein